MEPDSKLARGQDAAVSCRYGSAAGGSSSNGASTHQLPSQHPPAPSQLPSCPSSTHLDAINGQRGLRNVGGNHNLQRKEKGKQRQHVPNVSGIHMVLTKVGACCRPSSCGTHAAPQASRCSAPAAPARPTHLAGPWGGGLEDLGLHVTGQVCVDGGNQQLTNLAAHAASALQGRGAKGGSRRGSGRRRGAEARRTGVEPTLAGGGLLPVAESDPRIKA